MVDGTDDVKAPKSTDSVPVYCAHDAIVDVESLVENPRNPNRHPQKQLELLAKIIKTQGWRNPITVSNRSGFIVKGHGRLQAAKLAGIATAPIDRQDYENEAAEYADMIADNRIAELAEVDNQSLKELLEELESFSLDMELTGFDIESLEKLMEQFNTAEVEEDDFDADAEAAKITDAITKPGDVWQLGRHRLMCGDGTVATDVEKLMMGQLADLIFTDPPYNVDYTGKTKDALKIQNDKKDDAAFKQFLVDAFSNLSIASKEGAPIYICHADSEGLNFRSAMLEAGWLLKQCIIWVKQHFVMGRQDYQWRHEPILYGWKPGAAHSFYGDRKQDTVWEINRPMQNKEHPTMKPLGLCAKAIRNSSKSGDIVIDFFAGSGSTLIASEALGRTCYAMEIDPVYCDVIVKRYEQRTGDKAELLNG